MFKVRISKEAKFDLRERSHHYGIISEELRRKFLKNFNDTTEGLKHFPYFQIRYDNFRLRQVKGFPVMIHYILFEKEKMVKIYGIRFGQENPENYPEEI